MKDRKVAVRYARALLTSLPDSGSAERAEAFLESLADAFERSDDLRDALLNPAVPRSARKALLDSIVDRHEVHPSVKSFMGVVLANGRIANVPSIAEAFREAREQAEGIVPVSFETARPLTEDQLARARSTLEKLTSRRVRMSVAVNPGLIGGAVARVGSTVYDGSLRTQLANLRRRISEEP